MNLISFVSGSAPTLTSKIKYRNQVQRWKNWRWAAGKQHSDFVLQSSNLNIIFGSSRSQLWLQRLREADENAETVSGNSSIEILSPPTVTHVQKILSHVRFFGRTFGKCGWHQAITASRSICALMWSHVRIMRPTSSLWCLCVWFITCTKSREGKTIKHALCGALASSWTCKTSKAQGKHLDSYINMYVYVHIYM